MKKLLKALEEFDIAHGWDRYNFLETDEQRVDALQTETLYLLGELGEFANEIKKCRRDGTYKIDELREEAIDMLFFWMKISKILQMDPEEEFFKKLEKNEKRFVHLKKN